MAPGTQLSSGSLLHSWSHAPLGDLWKGQIRHQYLGLTDLSEYIHWKLEFRSPPSGPNSKNNFILSSIFWLWHIKNLMDSAGTVDPACDCDAKEVRDTENTFGRVFALVVLGKDMEYLSGA